MPDFTGYAQHKTEVKESTGGNYTPKRFPKTFLSKDGYCKGTVTDLEVGVWPDGVNEYADVCCLITEGELEGKRISGRVKLTNEGAGHKQGFNLLESCGVSQAKLAKAKSVSTKDVFGQLVDKECYFTVRASAFTTKEGETRGYSQIVRFVPGGEYTSKTEKLFEHRDDAVKTLG